MKSKIKKSLGNLKDKVTTGNNIPQKSWIVPEGLIPESLIRSESNYTKETWVAQIEAYCGELGILPTDLIETHRQSLKKPKKGLANDLGDRKFDKTNHSKFRSDLIKSKTGYSPKE